MLGPRLDTNLRTSCKEQLGVNWDIKCGLNYMWDENELKRKRLSTFKRLPTVNTPTRLPWAYMCAPTHVHTQTHVLLPQQ